MNTEKIKEVFSDQEFLKYLFALDTAAEVQAALKEKGVQMTEEEILALRELLLKMANGEITAEQLKDGELPEELLEQVAGGIGILGSIIIGVLVAANIGAMVTSIVGTSW